MNRTLAIVAVTLLALSPAAEVLALEEGTPAQATRTAPQKPENPAPAQASKATTPDAKNAPSIKEAQQAYSTGNYEEAFIIVEPLSKLNHPEAQYLLGQMYEFGRGVKQDTEKAEALFTAAASQGYAAAEAALGRLHMETAKDYASARNWFQKAADHGYALAYGALGDIYAHGYGVDRNHDKAIDYYKKSAEGGDAEACLKLGTIYEKGKDVQADKTQALFWYKKGAELGNKSCASALKRLETAK